ncbi:MAG: class I SAM-dependent methyltransferase [Nitrospira sp.]|nr:MAG: class I SAM-dependent methyltransferase [Nitrospira sp.]
MTVDYSTVTETAAARLTREALSMQYSRYRHAAEFCDGKDVLEVACGAGQGLGYLARTARRVVGGDYTFGLLRHAQGHYHGRIPLFQLDAQALPFRDRAFDVVLLYEAIYYLAQPERFLTECRRILRDNGVLLLCTVNREWSDFNPSPFSVRYYSAAELEALMTSLHFQVELRGAFPTRTGAIIDTIVSRVKRLAIALGLMPKTMKGKQVLKRLFLGELAAPPREVHDAMAPYAPAVPLASPRVASEFKIVMAVAHPEPSAGPR